MISDKLYVHLWLGEGYVPAGLLERKDGAFHFRYGKRFLANPRAFPLAPALPLRDTLYVSRSLFSVFRDACPDRWGRKLVAFREGRHPEEITDFDLLHPLNSPYRIGGLAFSPSLTLETYPHNELIAQSMQDIEAVQALVNHIDVADEESMAHIRAHFPLVDMIRRLEASFSLGGGRPKLAARIDGEDWIVKFGRQSDAWDDPQLEYATMLLAARCGIDVPEVRLVGTQYGNILLVRRFDRERGVPRHVISGFTLCNIEEDGAWGSYQRMAEHVRRHGDSKSGAQIFRRMVFNGLVYNLDDHPRNHAFFVTRQGICPTPAYDLVPMQSLYAVPELALACGNLGRLASYENFLSNVAPFGLRLPEAVQIVNAMFTVVADWRTFYAQHGCNALTLAKIGERLGKCLGTRP